MENKVDLRTVLELAHQVNGGLIPAQLRTPRQRAVARVRIAVMSDGISYRDSMRLLSEYDGVVRKCRGLHFCKDSHGVLAAVARKLA